MLKEVSNIPITIALKGYDSLRGKNYTMRERSKMIADAERECPGLIDESIERLKSKIALLNDSRPS